MTYVFDVKGDLILASTPPENLGPVSPPFSLSSTCERPPLATITDRLSPWTARILARSKRKEEETNKAMHGSVTEQQSDDNDSNNIFLSPTPPPPPLPPLTPPAPADDLQTSPLLFSHVDAAPTAQRRDAKRSTAEHTQRFSANDPDEEVSISQEAEEERRRWRSKEPFNALATKRRVAEKKRSTKRAKTNQHEETTEETLGVPSRWLDSRDLLRSPIRSLRPPQGEQPAVRKRLVQDENDRFDCDRDDLVGKENVVNRKREDANTNITVSGDRASEHQCLATPTSSPRTTLSVHAKCCHHTPKPAYSDMSDSLLKVPSLINLNSPVPFSTNF